MKAETVVLVEPKQKNYMAGDVPDKFDFESGVERIDGKTKKGLQVVHLLLSDGRIASVREGTGMEVEEATDLAATDKKKFITGMMAKVTKIDGQEINPFEFAKQLKMKDYLAIQTVFSEVNF